MERGRKIEKALQSTKRGAKDLRAIFKEVPGYVGCLESEEARGVNHLNMTRIKNDVLSVFDQKAVAIDEEDEAEIRFELGDILSLLEERSGLVMDNSDLEDAIDKLLKQIDQYVRTNMVFSSWKTADTNESIYNRYSSAGAKTVYLLQPRGKAPIEEKDYDGYGIFGGVDTDVWLIKHNVENVDLLNDEELKNIGLIMDVDFYVDPKSGTQFGCKKEINQWVADRHNITLFKDYSDILPGYNKDIKGMIATGTLERYPVSDFFMDPMDKFKYPLKFSFDKDAVYEDLPPSNRCYNYGFFAGEEGDWFMKKIFTQDSDEDASVVATPSGVPK